MKLLVTIAEAAELLGYSYWQMLKAPPVSIIRRPGRRPRVRVGDIEAYVNGQKLGHRSQYSQSCQSTKTRRHS